ncbi:hypothetical protein ACFX15_027815 [Malus domestica]
MVGKGYHLFRISFAGDFAHSVYEEARFRWVDDKNDMVIEFEFKDQPVVYMKYSADAKPMIICKATKQNLDIIPNCKLAMWSVHEGGFKSSPLSNAEVSVEYRLGSN